MYNESTNSAKGGAMLLVGMVLVMGAMLAVGHFVLQPDAAAPSQRVMAEAPAQ